MNDYVAAVLFFLPAGVANMSPVLANRLPLLRDWNTPLDFGYKWRGKRILGDNKRVRGLVFGTLMGGLSAVIISKLNINTVVTLDPVWVGILLGFGALFGDAFESYLKRLRNIAPGQSWFPFDQTDYIFGGLLFIIPFVNIPLWVVATIFVAYFGLHIAFSYLAYLLDLKDKPI